MNDENSIELLISAKDEAKETIDQIAAAAEGLGGKIKDMAQEAVTKFADLDDAVTKSLSSMKTSVGTIGPAARQMATETSSAAVVVQGSLKAVEDGAAASANSVAAATARIVKDVDGARARLARVREGFLDGSRGADYATKALQNFGNAADRMPFKFMEGARLVSSSGAMLVKDVAKTASDTMRGLLAGNWAMVGLNVAATVYGAFLQKKKEKEQEIKRLDDEALKAAEKIAKENADAHAKMLEAKKSAEEKYNVGLRDLIYAQRKMRDEAFDVDMAKIDDEAKKRKDAQQGDLLVAYQALQKAQMAAEGPSRTDKEKEEKAKALAMAQQTFEIVKGNRALIERETLLKKNTLQFERQKAAEAEAERARVAALATLRGIVNERGRLLESTLKSAAAEVRMLGYTKEERQYASDIQRIEDLRGAGLEDLARTFEVILAAKRMYVEYDKAQAEVERLREDRKAATKELDKKAEALSAEEGLQGRINALAREYQDLVDRGADATRASSVLAKAAAKMAEAAAEQAQEKVAAIISGNAALEIQLGMAAKAAEMDARILEYRKKGYDSMAAAAEFRKSMLPLEEQAAIDELKRQEEIARVKKEGTREELAALEQKYRLEDRILQKKRDQILSDAKAKAEPRSARDFLANMGIEVSVSGGKTKTDYGIRKRRDERARQLREENLARERGWNPAFENWLAKDKKATIDSTAAAFNFEEFKIEGAKIGPSLPSIPDLAKPKVPNLGSKTSAVEADAASKAAELKRQADEAAEAAKAATRTATALEGATAALKDMASKMGDSATAADKGAAATTETQASAAGLKEAMERSTKQMEELAALFTQLRDAQASSGEGSAKAVATIANKIVDLQRQMDQQRKAMEDAVKLLNGLGG